VITISLLDYGALAQIQAIVKKLENLPSERRRELEAIVRRGIRSSFNTLSMGGSVQDASGFGVRWSQVRHPMTRAIRQRRGLGAVFPILSLTGKLERGLFGGTFSSSGNRLSYEPASSERALILAHQRGDYALPSRRGISTTRGRAVRLPPRPTVFWSKGMSEEVSALARSTFNEQVRA
jgi:hypothetical protein